MHEFAAGETVFKENDPGSDLFLVKSGTLEVVSGEKVIRVIGKYDYFGERSLLFNAPRSATVRVRTPVSCVSLRQAKFLAFCTEEMRRSLLSRIEAQDSCPPFSNLYTKVVIGRGMFGEVILAQDRVTEKQYALKAVPRNKIVRYHLYSSIQSEREILSQVDHNMIVHLYGSYQDEENIYLLLEYVQGTDLFTAIRDLGLVSEADSRFYVGCLILVLEYLHERDIIYRDLKPENVMLDSAGYPKLVDFGSAKLITGRTYTVTGTPHYMAPEVVVGKGYNQSADFWSLGVMLYEFICGGVPFGEDFEDPYDIYEEVLQGDLTFPAFLDQHFPAKPLIEQLLSRTPAMRLGGNISMLKQHHWLRSTPWTELLRHEFSAPYIPTTRPFIEEVTVPDSSPGNQKAHKSPQERYHPPEPGWDRDF